MEGKFKPLRTIFEEQEKAYNNTYGKRLDPECYEETILFLQVLLNTLDDSKYPSTISTINDLLNKARIK